MRLSEGVLAWFASKRQPSARLKLIRTVQVGRFRQSPVTTNTARDFAAQLAQMIAVQLALTRLRFEGTSLAASIDR